MFEDIKVRKSPRQVQAGEHSSRASLRLLHRLGNDDDDDDDDYNEDDDEDEDDNDDETGCLL